MINLLGAEQKRELRSARLNTALLNYVFVAGITLACVILLALFSTWWLSNRIGTAQMQQKANEAATQPYASITAQGTSFSGNLSKIQSVISNRSHYGTALLNIAAALPTGVSLQSLQLSPTFLTTPLKLTVTADDTQAALTVKQQLSESKIFSAVTLDNTDCPPTGRCTVNITATLSNAVFNEAAE